MKYVVPLFSLLFITSINGMSSLFGESNSESEAFELIDRRNDQKDIHSGDDKSKLLDSVKPTQDLDIQQSIKLLLQQLNQNSEQIAQLTLKVIEQETLFKTQNEKFSITESKVKAAESKIKDTESKMKVAENKVKTAEDKMQAAEDKVKEAENKIKFAELKAKETKKQLDDLQNTVNTGIGIAVGGVAVVTTTAIVITKKLATTK